MVANGDTLIGFTVLNLKKVYIVNANNFYLLPEKVRYDMHGITFYESHHIMCLSMT